MSGVLGFGGCFLFWSKSM